MFGQLAAGRSNREIADELHVAEGTVKIHVGRILAKLEPPRPGPGGRVRV